MGLNAVTGVIGGISRDHIVYVGRAPQFDLPGGPGLYATLGAALGVHGYGSHALRLATNLSTDTRDIELLLDRWSVDHSSSISSDITWRLWILNSPQGRRVVPTSSSTHELEDVTGAPEPEFDPPPSFFENLDSLLVCAPQSVDHLVGRISKETKVGVDPDQRALASRGWTYIDELSSVASVLLPSRVQLDQLGRASLSRSALETARAIRDRTDRDVVARLDQEGCVVLPREGGEWRVADTLAKAIDTTGAGDSHAGALVAALSLPNHSDYPPLVQAAVVATAVASHTVRLTGTTALELALSAGGLAEQDFDGVTVTVLSH